MENLLLIWLIFFSGIGFSFNQDQENEHFNTEKQIRQCPNNSINLTLETDTAVGYNLEENSINLTFTFEIKNNMVEFQCKEGSNGN